MKATPKKAVSLLLSSAMVLSMCPTAFADETISEENQETVTQEMALPRGGGASNMFYVKNNDGNDDTGDGTQGNPYLTIEKAVQAAQDANQDVFSIYLMSDVESSLEMVFDGDYEVTISGQGQWGIKYTGTKPIGNKSGFIKVTDGASVSFEDITLSGSTGAYEGRVIYAANGGYVHVEDSAIRKGRVNNPDTYMGGAGIFVASGGEVVVGNDTTISDCETTGGGGAIYVADGGTLSIAGTDIAITGNKADQGGGIYAATQSGTTGGLQLAGPGMSSDKGIEISENEVVDKAACLYVEKDSKVSVSGLLKLPAGTTEAKRSIWLDEDATMEIAGPTYASILRLCCEDEYPYRLVATAENYSIVSDGATADELGWTDDCGTWDIRHMTYNGVEGLYLYYQTRDVTFHDVDTLAKIEGSAINGTTVDYKTADIPNKTTSNGTMSLPGLLPKGTADYPITSDYTVTFEAKDGYRIPTEDVVKVTGICAGESAIDIDFSYEPDFENGTATITIVKDVLNSLDAKWTVNFEISAEKLYDLTLRMNGPLYSMTSSITNLTQAVIDLSESNKTGTTASYKVTRNDAPVSGVVVELYKEGTSAVAATATTGADGRVSFSNLDENATYFPVLKYEDTYKVIKRDVISLTFSTLEGQTLSSSYAGTVGTVAYDSSAQGATIQNVQSDGTLTFAVDQSKDGIIFNGNEGAATTAPATLSLGGNTAKGMLSKELEQAATTYGTLATATLVGYTFNGWFTEAEGGAQVKVDTPYNAATSPKTLYAHWTARNDTKYQIKHWVEYTEGGANERYVAGTTETTTVDGVKYYLFETTTHQYTSDQIVDISDFDIKEMTGTEYTWWTRQGFTAKAQEVDCKVLANGSAVFGMYYDRKQFNLIYKTPVSAGTASNDTPIENSKVYFGALVGEMPTPTLPGYEFAGWYKNDQLFTSTTIYDQIKDTSLTAHWNAKKDTKYAVRVVTQDIERNDDGVYVLPGTYTELKTVYLDNDGKLFQGETDTPIIFVVADVNALNIEGFKYIGYSDKLDTKAEGITKHTTLARGTVKPTDKSTEKNGEYNEEFDGELIYLYYDRLTKTIVTEDGQGNTNDDEEIIYGGDFTWRLPPDPKKDGYDFKNWVDDDDNVITDKTPADDYVTNPDGEIIVTPTWTARKYHLTYVPGEKAEYVANPSNTQAPTKSDNVPGGYIDSNEVTYDEKIGPMPSAQRKGHDFDGWETKDGNAAGELITSETVLTVDNVVLSNAPTYEHENTRPLYAKYTPHEYVLDLIPGNATLTGDQGQVDPTSITVTFGQKVANLPTPTLRGYRFVGWVLDKNRPAATRVKNGLVWEWEYTNGAHIPVYATWVPESYRYTFDLNDSTGSTKAELVDTTIEWVDEKFDSYYDGIFEVEASRPGYIFGGWALTATEQTPLTAEDFNGINSDTTLYAIWTPIKYDVTFVMKGGVFDPRLDDNNHLESYDPSAVYSQENDTWTIKVAFDTIYGELPIPQKDKTLYHGFRVTALGWPTTDEFGATIHNTIIKSLPQYIDYVDEKGIVLAAVLEPYFTFDPDSGKFSDGTETPKDILQSEIDKLPDVEKDGYTHEGWTDKDGNDVSLDDVKASEEPMELKPKYIANITMDANGGKVDDKETVTVSMSTLEQLPDATREGYVFDGWYTERDGGQKADFSKMKEENVPATVYAHWKLAVTFNANGGTVNGKSVDIIAISSLLTLPTATRSNYTFNGWFTEQTAGTQFDLAAVKALTEPKTLYAHWTYNAPSGGGGIAVSYTVIFDSNGGSEVPSQTTSGKVKEPTAPTKAFYEFAGWFKDAALTEQFNFDKDRVKADTTLYAKWSYKGPSAYLNLDHFAYISGFSDGSVRPTAMISRAEVAMIFYRLLNEETRTQHKTTKHQFVDVEEGSWCETAIATLASMGILEGRGHGIYDPTAEITRAEFAVIASRFDTLEEAGEEVLFEDLDKDAWYYAGVMSAAAKGWVKGISAKRFAPLASISRAEVVTLINRVLGRATEEFSVAAKDTKWLKTWPDNMNKDLWYYYSMQEATNTHDFKTGVDKDGESCEVWTQISETDVKNS